MPDTPDQEASGTLAEYLASVPALLGYVPSDDTVAVATTIRQEPFSERTWDITAEQACDPQRRQALILAHASGIDQGDSTVIALVVDRPELDVRSQTGTAVCSDLGSAVIAAGAALSTLVASGFSPEDSWLPLGSLDQQAPLRQQLSSGLAVPDWRHSLSTLQRAESGMSVLPHPDMVGGPWRQGAESTKVMPIEPQSAILAIVSITEAMAHGNAGQDGDGLPASEYSVPSVAAAMQDLLVEQPLRGFMLVPLITAHAQELVRVLEAVVPHTRGAGRSHLLDWAAAASLASGDQLGAEAALAAAATSEYADGPTEMGAILYTAMASEADAGPVLDHLLGKGMQQLYRLDPEGTVALGSAASAVAHRQGHDVLGSDPAEPGE